MKTKERIDINSASTEELAELPRIGIVHAWRIVEYRRDHGPFKKIEELMNVEGIDVKRFGEVRELVTVEPRSPTKDESEKPPRPYPHS